MQQYVDNKRTSKATTLPSNIKKLLRKPTIQTGVQWTKAFHHVRLPTVQVNRPTCIYTFMDATHCYNQTTFCNIIQNTLTDCFTLCCRVWHHFSCLKLRVYLT